ncbi:amphi-Trp domain-containing protein [Amycolatopsis taiwanensis]|uniref:Amphi-Trp domain-containing protein n=1 Tax=Amycolatopsis taiwanensis TaxID=342230 RepID=A0A9W6VFM6_9PSEU|nr:amphi-Trp domain-containing protein [Amycolatopsis taiwanensis]GLY64656.1 hypothetical protein Atai01_12750 [Amycolatopsis taiwanensis]
MTTKHKTKQTMTRAEAADWLSSLARVLAAGGGEVEIAGQQAGLRVADQISAKIETETDADEHEIEIEFSWTVTPSPESEPSPEPEPEPPTP